MSNETNRIAQLEQQLRAREQRRAKLVEENASLRKRHKELIAQLVDMSSQFEEQRRRTFDLENAIRWHHEQSVGHNVCWMNDVKIWELVGIKQTLYPHIDDAKRPTREEILIGCAHYVDAHLLRDGEHE